MAQTQHISLKNLIERISSNTVLTELVRNSGLLSIGQVYQMSLSALLNILLARQLGAEMYGIFLTVQVMVGIILVIARMGVEVPAKREVSRDPAMLQTHFGSALAILLTISAPATLVASLLIGSVLGLASVSVVSLMVLLLVSTALTGLLQAAMQSLNYFGVSAKVTIASQTGYVAIVAVATWLNPDLVLVLVIMVLGQGAVFLLNFYVLKSLGFGFGPVWNCELWQSMLRDGFPVMLANSTEYVNVRADSLIVGVLLGPASAGIYGVAYVFFQLLCRVVYLPALAAFPAMARLSATSGLEAYRRFVGKLSLAIFGYAVVLGSALFILAPLLLSLLYSPEFAASLTPMHILMFALPFLALNRLMVQVLNAADLAKWTFRATALGAVFNVAMNLVMIPQFGLTGAAITTVATEALVWILALFGFVRGSQAKSWPSITQESRVGGKMGA